MFARVLFSFVWLIIAAGLVLPLYPGDVATTTVTAASDPVQLVAGSDLADCEDCPVADLGRSCQSDCPCGRALPAVFVPLERTLSWSIAARPQLPGTPAKLPARLPAI